MDEFEADNRNILAEIRGLREDLDDLGEYISGIQMVTDTGALVGQLAGPLDRELGARTIYARRGI